MQRALGSPTRIVFFFVVLVLFLQLAYLVLVRPYSSDQPPGEKIIGFDFVLLSTVKSYKPVKLHTLVGHRKDDTNSITLIFLEESGLKLTKNFLVECIKLEIYNYVIFALDNYTTCEKLGDDHCYFDSSYNFTSRHSRDCYKINTTMYLVQQGYNVFSSHKDVLLFDNPLLVWFNMNLIWNI